MKSNPFSDACALEIGALEFPVGFCRAWIGCSGREFLLLGCAPREIDAVLAGHRTLLSGNAARYHAG